MTAKRASASLQAMEILSKPWEGNNWHHDTECGECGVRFRGDIDDLFHARFKVSGYYFAGTAVIETRYYFDCPECGRYVIIGDGSDFPTWVRYKAVDGNA